MIKNIKIGSFTHPERGIVAGVLVLGRTGAEVGGAFISVDAFGIPTVYGPISQPANAMKFDLATTFDHIQGVAGKAAWADKFLSDGLSYFGLFRRRDTDTIIDLCTRAQADLERHPDDETVAEIRRAFMTAMAPVVGALDTEALNALRATSGFSRSDFAFYARGDGGSEREKRRTHRLQAAAAYPMLAAAMARNLSAKLAIDAAKPLTEALIGAFGRRDQKAVFTKGSLRRLQGLDWPVPNGVTPEWLAEKLGALPPDWFPKTPEHWEAFLTIARGLGRTLPTMTGFSFPDLLAGCGGNWTDFRRRLAKAYTDTRPPENLDEEKRRDWLRNPVRPDESFDALQNAVIELETMVETFARLVVLPAAATLGGDVKPYLGEAQRIASRQAAANLLFAGKNTAAMFEVSRHFATQLEHVLAAVAGEETAPSFREVAADGWAPLCNAVVAPNGVSIVPLTDPRELKDEGEDLSHCVSGYSEQCRRGHHILSFRLVEPSGQFKRLSTIELGPVADGERSFRVCQHRGKRNGPPPALAAEAWDWFKMAVADGRIALNYQGIRHYLVAQVAKWNDDVERACRYEWREEGAIERALRAFELYLPKGLRNLPLQQFVELPEIIAVGSEITPRRVAMPA